MCVSFPPQASTLMNGLIRNKIMADVSHDIVHHQLFIVELETMVVSMANKIKKMSKI